ncbi:MAG: tetratricopeptide repeat protein [Barnesiella sp.]
MKSRLKLFLSLILVSTLVATVSAANYKDGIEYFKAGQPDRAKILLEKNLNDPTTDKAEAYYYLGEIAFGDKKYDEAKKNYQAGFTADPMNMYNKIGLAKVEMRTNPKAAENMIKDAVGGKNKKNAGLNLAAAIAFYQNGVPGYEEYLEKALKADKKYPDIYMFQGDILADKKQYGDAAGSYETAILFDPNCVEAYVKYSHIYFPINPTMAVQKLEELLQLAPESALAQREMAEAYYKNDQFNKAAEAYAKYMQNPNHFENDRARYSTLLFYDKKYNESQAIANEILAKNPEDFTMRRISMFNAYEMKNFADAEAAGRAYLNQDKYKKDYIARDYSTYGYVLLENKKTGEAVEQFVKAYELDTAKHDMLKEISDAYRLNGDYANAIKYYEMFMNSDEENMRTNSYYSLGGLYYRAATSVPADSVALRDEYLDAAQKNFNVVVEKAPEDYRGYLWIARSLSVKDPETKDGLAKPAYEQLLLVLDKDSANKTNATAAYIEVYKYLGYYHYLKNEIALTKEYWNKMLEFDPENVEIKETLKQLP